MTFDWIKLLEVAQYLSCANASALHPEARCRSVINRAYYCAYNLAAEYAQQNLGFQVSHTGYDHTGVLDCFRQCTSFSPQKRTLIAESLKRLKKQRRYADYFGDRPTNNKKAQAAMRDAQTVIQELSSP